MVRSMVGGIFDDLTETDEEQSVREDTARAREGKPLKHHRSEDHLTAHRQDLWFEERNKERQREERQKHAEQMQRMREAEEQDALLEDIPIDDELVPEIDQ